MKALSLRGLRWVRSTSLILLAAVCPCVGSAATLTNADPVALAAAIGQGGTVRLAFDGVVKLPSSLVIEADTTVDASGHTVTLDGNGVVRHFVVTNGASLRLVNLTLINGRFVGDPGGVLEVGSAGMGGSIYHAGGALELTGCKLINNQVVGGEGGPSGVTFFAILGGSGYGGALYSTNGHATVTDCWFADNLVTGGPGGTSSDSQIVAHGGAGSGGAIYSTNTSLVLTRTTFTNNLAQGGQRASEMIGRASGGALAVFGETAHVSNCIFVDNRVMGGTSENGNPEVGLAAAGAVFHDGGAMRIEGSLFERNQLHGGPGGPDRIWTPKFGTAEGGALFNQSGRLELRDCSLIQNSAAGGTVPEKCAPCATITGRPSYGGDAYGGAIYNRGELALVNCTLAENRAEGGDNLWEDWPWAIAGGGYGGAIYSQTNTVSLLNVTLARNAVAAGEGRPYANRSLALGSSIMIDGGTATQTNTVLSCAAGQTNVWGPVRDGGHNLCSDASAGFTSSTSRGNLDPLLGPLGNYGGPTPTLPLLPDSPALDAGDDSVAPAADQRGVTRPQGWACDIGAFELAPRLSLSGTAEGKVRVNYLFQAGRTNRVSVSPDLVTWEVLGLRVSDSNGVIQIEETDPAKAPTRFYRVELE